MHLNLEDSILLATRKGDKHFIDGGDTRGVYLHVPFCSTSCDFCAFYQEQSDRKGILEYLDGIDRELSLIARSGPVQTFFWGGGTPGLLPAKDLDRLCRSMTGHFGQPELEWTVEMAPSSVKEDKLKALRDNGVTRISMGIQSLNDASLESLGRQHSRKQVLTAYDRVRAAGFESVNLDLIFAIPGQSREQWQDDLREAALLEPDHLSTYCLTFEEDTALFVRLSEGKVSIDEMKEVDFFRISWEEMARAGFEQYEISNYAKPGHACLHNCHTWRMGEWIGVGPSAASQEGGERYSNPSDLKLWLSDLDSGWRGASDRSSLGQGVLFEDSLIFGLRMNAGVNLQALQNRYALPLPDSVESIFRRLELEGRLERVGSQLCLTAEGRMVADAVGEELLGCFADECPE